MRRLNFLLWIPILLILIYAVSRALTDYRLDRGLFSPLKETRTVAVNPIPIIIEQDYKGYVLVEFRGEYLAIEQDLRDVDLRQLQAHEFGAYEAARQFFRRGDLQTVRVAVDDFLNEQEGPPVLVELDYKGFNLVLYHGEYFAVAQDLGPIDLPLLAQTLSDYEAEQKIFRAATLEDLRTAVDEFAEAAPPVLVEEGYRGFNLVLYHGEYFALAQDLGRIDLPLVDTQTLSDYEAEQKIFRATTLEDLRTAVDRFEMSVFSPVVVAVRYKGFNLVPYEDEYIAIAESLGTLDLAQTDEQTLADYEADQLIIRADSLEAVKAAIDDITTEGE